MCAGSSDLNLTTVCLASINNDYISVYDNYISMIWFQSKTIAEILTIIVVKCIISHLRPSNSFCRLS